jgi:hypothetical protein
VVLPFIFSAVAAANAEAMADKLRRRWNRDRETFEKNL